MNQAYVNFGAGGTQSEQPRMRPLLGKVLIDSGRLRLDQVEEILRRQKELGLRFGDAGLGLGLLTAADLEHALAAQFGYSYAAPGEGNLSKRLAAAHQPFGDEAESLRSLRTQLLVKWFDRPRNALAIVGSSPGDGASYVAANLAIVFAQLGRRTLLIDADLRSPRQHEYFGVEGRQGLSDWLTHGSGREAILRIAPFPNLFVLPGGTTPPNPQELLGSYDFRNVFEHATELYDVILIDTSSQPNVADAQTVAAIAGGAVMVIRKNSTRYQQASARQSQISAAGAEVVGAVVNQF